MTQDDTSQTTLDEASSSEALTEEGTRDPSTPRVVIISGMSGSGKSTALRALEDVGFFCIDNLPVPLLPRVLELAASRADGRAAQPYAFVVDTRASEFLSEATRVIEQLREEGVTVQVVFLDAEDEVLVRRYSETRRRHPMSDGGTVREGIERERSALEALRAGANAVIDTSSQTPHTLKALVQELVAEVASPTLTITVLSFGFKHSLPPECDLVFDVRFLPNPYFVEGMRAKNGLDREVADYVLSFSETIRFIELCMNMLDFTIPQYAMEGKTYLTIGVGCTGGKHRSVAVAEVIASRLRGRGLRADTRHRDSKYWPSPAPAHESEE